MMQDKSVRDQKVFVKLSAVLELQNAYLQALVRHEEKRGSGNVDVLLAERVRTIGAIIKVLDLPIEIK